MINHPAKAPAAAHVAWPSAWTPRVRLRRPGETMDKLEREQRVHRTAKPLPVQLVQLAVDLVEEDKRIQPLQHVRFAHLDGHVPRARTDHELEIELLVGILLGELDGE